MKKTPKTGQGDVLAILHASAGRRVFGVGILGGLGVILLSVAITQPPSDLIWRLFLLGAAGTAIWMAVRMWQATSQRIELTETELRTSDGKVIARVADIEHVDRGAFAFKPSNGFLLRLSKANARAWQPGLWWRMGRRVGIGGVTPGAQSRAMADVISAMIATR